MALLTWDESYSVRVEKLDGQHTVLFDILNDLHAAMMKGEAHTMTGPLLQKMLDYTRTHFAAEEKLLEASNYPGFNEHHKIHAGLIAQVEDYIARFEKGEISLSLHLINFLRDWLTNHIQKTDKDYSGWLNEHDIH